MFRAMAHQKRVVPLMTRGNVMLVWDPGTGKTYPTLAAAQFLDDPLLCVVPAHLREQWAENAKEHVPLLRCRVLEKTNVKADLDGADIVIVSYEYASTLARWKELRRWKWGAIALDEAHYLMNLDANRTRALLGSKPLTERNGLVFAADCVWPLTGTPFQFPHQIYPLLAALFPKALDRPARNGPGAMTLKEWENEFCQFAPDPSGFGERVVGAKNIPELRRRLEPFLDKVKLEEAAPEMKGLTVDTIPIKGSLTNLTRGLPQDVVAQYHALTEILLDDDIPDDEKLAALEDGGLVMAQLRHTIAVAKVKPTIKIIENELASGQKKVLVFGWHKEPLRALAAELDAPLITGASSKTAKREALDEFIKGSTPYLIGQISAIGTGTDGLQAVCHRSIFMEASWAYRDNKQCLHRTYRKGQQFPCHASFVSLLGTVDEYVSRVLKRNAEIVRQVLD